MLTRYKGMVEVVECRDKLGGFKTRKGLTAWKVLDDRKGFISKEDEEREDYEAQLHDCFNSYSSFADAKDRVKANDRIHASMFFPD